MDSIEKAVHSASQAFPKGPLREESSSQDIQREYLVELNGKRNLARTYIYIHINTFLIKILDFFVL